MYRAKKDGPALLNLKHPFDHWNFPQCLETLPPPVPRPMPHQRNMFGPSNRERPGVYHDHYCFHFFVPWLELRIGQSDLIYQSLFYFQVYVQRTAILMHVSISMSRNHRRPHITSFHQVATNRWEYNTHRRFNVPKGKAHHLHLNVSSRSTLYCRRFLR